MDDKNIRKAITISVGVHLAVFAGFFFKGCTQTSVIAIPQVYQVQLIAMPDIQPAPAEEVVEEINVESIPPPPDEKKRLQPKPKKEAPKPKKSTDKIVLGKTSTNQALSGMRSDENFGDYPYYLSLMVNKISRNWVNPYAGQAESVIATVYFRIDRSGQLSDIRVEKSSGVPSFDRAAQRAVLNSNPLPPLPEDYRERQLTVHLDFEYKPQ